MIRKDYLNPKCPRCCYSLCGLNDLDGAIRCPECNCLVTRTESVVGVSRWKFALAGVVLLLVVPTVNMFFCWGVYFDSLGYGSEQMLTIVIYYSMLYLLLSGVLVFLFRRRFRLHLEGVYRTPSGWLITLVVLGSWLISLLAMVASMGLWKWDLVFM